MAAEAAEALVFSEHRRGTIYARTWSRSREKLESGLLKLYGRGDGHQALIFPSGMAAIGATLAALAQSKQAPFLLVYGDELYCEVPRTVRYVAEAASSKVGCLSVDITKGEELLKLFKQKAQEIGIFHFEACTNPSGQFFDFSLVPELRKLAPDCIFVCDNTWLSGSLFNPLDHAADLVVESMTKYVSAGTCIGGHVLGCNGLMAPIFSWIKAFGVFVASDHCELFLSGLESLQRRMEATGVVALAVAQHLESHPMVNRVMYPMLPSHPTHRTAKRYLKGSPGSPGCLWFHVSAKKNRALEMMSGPVECKTSFGAASSRVDPFPKAGVCDGTPGTWLRLSVGYEEDVTRLLHALDVFLSQLTTSAADAKAYAKDEQAAETTQKGEGRWRRKQGA